MDRLLRLRASEDGADAGREAALLRDLRADLLESSVFDAGALIVAVGESAAALIAVLSVVKAWLRRGSPTRRVVLELDEDTITLTGGQATGRDETGQDETGQDEIAESFVRRHTRAAPDQSRGIEIYGPTRGIPAPGPETADAGIPADEDEAPVGLNVAADIPSLVRVGTVESVTCHISADEIDTTAGRTRDDGRVGADPARLITVELLPKANVEVIGEHRAELPVPGEGESAEAYFDVRPTQAGTCRVWVVVRQGPVPLLTLRLDAAAVGPGNGPGEGNGPGVRYPARARTAVTSTTGLEDVTWLSVVETDRGEDTVYRYELRSTSLGILATFESPPLRRRAEFVANLYREIESRWLSTRGDADAFGAELREFGGSLLSQLFPERLQEILWRNRDRLRDMMVLSSEPFIPWELVHLKEPGQPLPDQTCFLAEIGLVRWLYTRDNAYPPQALRARPGHVHVLCPDYAEPGLRLPQARAEARFLTESLGASEVPADEHSVRALLRSGRVDVLHFAGHGLADGSDIANAKILLRGRRENGGYIRSWLSATAVEQQAKLAGPDGSKPLVVLNACQAGRLGQRMSGLGGFAQAFLERGAGAFISGVWSVGDRPASTFVTALYGELLDGRTMSAAARTARLRARRAGDGTWLAYAVYAHPKARLLHSRP